MDVLSPPRYGRMTFSGLDELFDRLRLVQRTHLGQTPFSAYLATFDQQRLYGLDLSELEIALRTHAHDFASFTASCQTSTGKMIRIHVKAPPLNRPTQGQFLISTGSNQLNKALEGILTGTKSRSSISGSIGNTLGLIGNVIPSFRQQPPAVDRPSTFRYPTISTTESFFFDLDIVPDSLLSLVNRLSDTFLNRSPFHIRMETTDGDYHFHLDRNGLNFLFNHRRNKILNIYLDSASLDGQWVNIRLSFHPLAQGPNGEVDITSHHSEEICNMIEQTIGIPPHKNDLPRPLSAAFQLEAKWFDLHKLIWGIQEVAKQYLDRVPPVAFVSTTHGASHAGLSMFQLKRWEAQAGNTLDWLSIGIHQIMTGQSCSITCKVKSKDWITVMLHIHWGNAALHQAVADFLQTKMGFKSTTQPDQVRVSENRLSQGVITLMPQAKWNEELERILVHELRKNDIHLHALSHSYAYQAWNEACMEIAASDFLMVDVSQAAPHIYYQIGIAEAMGKPIIYLALESAEIAAEFSPKTLIRYIPTAWSFLELKRQVVDILESR
ncbi:hypothetical protein [Pontibacter sp. G13]|uniref:hypothetical protein n=1 Tax=Pontibacter sp. G13 TaxID=3074898 RepID=UPI0028890115|nr:hypothetical protein [Pontibacter sp. G13]WNJ21492.1 hypothetical protein RJD25_13565 [Pontibacter sp. G13]